MMEGIKWGLFRGPKSIRNFMFKISVRRRLTKPRSLDFEKKYIAHLNNIL